MIVESEARSRLYILREFCEAAGYSYTRTIWKIRSAQAPVNRRRWKWPAGCGRKNGAFVLPVHKPSNVHPIRGAK